MFYRNISLVQGKQLIALEVANQRSIPLELGRQNIGRKFLHRPPIRTSAVGRYRGSITCSQHKPEPNPNRNNRVNQGTDNNHEHGV